MNSKTFRLIGPLVLILMAALSGCGQAGYDGSTDASKPTSSTLASNQKPSKLAAVVARSVVRSAELAVRVKDVEATEKEITTSINKMGGFVEESRSGDLTSTSPSLTMKIRVPAARFEETIDSFSSKGTVISKSTKGEDVTAQLVDFEARLKVMRAQEDSFRNMLAKSSNLKESLDIQSRVSDLRGQIESLDGQRKSMADLAALSTVDLTLLGEARAVAATADGKWPQESWNSATSALGKVIEIGGSTAVFVAVFSPLWLPLGWLLFKALRSSRKEAARP